MVMLKGGVLSGNSSNENVKSLIFYEVLETSADTTRPEYSDIHQLEAQRRRMHDAAYSSSLFHKIYP